MPKRGQGQNFYTNDSTTLAKFDQEAQLWARGFQNASRPKASFAGTMGTIGLVLSLIMNLIWLLGHLGARVFQWLRTA